MLWEHMFIIFADLKRWLGPLLRIWKETIHFGAPQLYFPDPSYITY